MKFGTRKRWAVLIALLTAALSAAAWVREGDKATDADVVEAPSRKARPASVTAAPREQAADRVHLEKLRARSSAERTDDAFAPRSWRSSAPKAAAVAVVAAPPPTAPPLPFAYMGKLMSDDERQIFLMQGERNLIVHEGDVIDSLYRVERLSDAGVTFVHLPTGIRQDLAIGEPQ